MKARVVLLIATAALGFGAAVLLAGHPGTAQGAPSPTTSVATTSVGTTTTAAPTGSTSAAFRGAFWRIVLLILVISSVWAIPVIIDLFKAYRYQERLLKLFEDLTVKTSAKDGGLTVDDLRALFATKFVPTSPSGVNGLARSLMALTIATTITIALIVFLAVGSNNDRALVRTIVTTLLAAFTTIIGFYFGARTAEGANAAGADAAVAAAAAGAESAKVTVEGGPSKPLNGTEGEGDVNEHLPGPDDSDLPVDEPTQSPVDESENAEKVVPTESGGPAGTERAEGTRTTEGTEGTEGATT